MPWLRSLICLIGLVSFASADELMTLDNKVISGTVVAVNDKEVSIKMADGSVIATPLDNVIALKLRDIKKVAAGVAYSDIRLVDDTALLCASYQIKGKTIEAKLLTGQSVRIPMESVVSILRDAQDPKLKKDWDGLVAQYVKRDRVITYDGSEINSIDGTVGEADAEGTRIQFRPTDGDPIRVPIKNLQGMIFYREAPASAPAAVCLVYDVMGNAFAAVKVEASGSNFAIHTTIPQVTIECEASSIARFDYNMGKLVFLSDLTPAKVLEKSAIGLIIPYRRDVNLDGDPIALDRQYTKGLSLHAFTDLEYDLKGKFKKFSAVLGVDPRVGGDSQAKVVIELDGKVLFSEVVTAKKVEAISLDVVKGSNLRIVVSSQNLLDLHDHVTIANAKLTK